MTNAFCASVNFDAFTPNLLAQPRMSTAENSSCEWSSFQGAEHFRGQFGSLSDKVDFRTRLAENCVEQSSRHPLRDRKSQFSWGGQIGNKFGSVTGVRFIAISYHVDN